MGEALGGGEDHGEQVVQSAKKPSPNDRRGLVRRSRHEIHGGGESDKQRVVVIIRQEVSVPL